MPVLNRRWVLDRRPQGPFTPDLFRLDTEEVPEPGSGQFVIRNEWYSIDPAISGWISSVRSYIPPVEIGAVVRAFAAGRVVRSNHPDFHEGDCLTGLFGLQEYAVSDGTAEGYAVRRAVAEAPLSASLGVLGLTGQSAYWGLVDVGRPQGRETVVVSAAAGAVGSAAVQIAANLGCKVVGIAGGPEKCARVVEYGADACIDYKSDDVGAALKEACPEGIDIFFDNVGGDILNAVLRRINRGARIALCGGISQYNGEAPKGPSAYLALLMNRARMQGFLYFDYESQFDKSEALLADWYLQGRLRSEEEVVEGFERIPWTLDMLFEGRNRGKLLVHAEPK